MCYVSLVIQFVYGWGYERIRGGVAGDGVRLIENGREWRVPYLLYEDDLFLCGESEECLRGLAEKFGIVCKSEDCPRCEVMLDGEQLEQVFEFKYLGYMLDEKETDDAECSRKAVNSRKVAGAIKSLVNVKGLSLECARVLHEGML